MTLRSTACGLLLFAAISLMAVSRPASPAAPRIIMFFGEPLSSPVYLTNWDENMAFITEVSSTTYAPPEVLNGRLSIRVALFWGSERWEAYAADTAQLRQLQPTWAEEQAAFYPAQASQPPVFHYFGASHNSGPRSVGGHAIALLKKYRIPVAVP